MNPITETNSDPKLGRILVIEEDQNLIIAYRAIVEPVGFEVIGALNGEEALNLLKRGRGRFVLVITDMDMLDGATFIHEIHAEYPLIPTLNCSLNMKEGMKWVEQGLFVGSLPKPFDVAHFSRVVLICARTELERRSGEDRRKSETAMHNAPLEERRKEERRKPLTPGGGGRSR